MIDNENMTILTFQQALDQATGNKHLLLGNGFSISCRPDLFLYDKIFNQADFSSLSVEAKELFGLMETSNFEDVMYAMKQAVKLIKLYHNGEQCERQTNLIEDAEKLKDILVKAIANNHPTLPSEISNTEYEKCLVFLNNFKNIYTLNYDLLLYWTRMYGLSNKKIKFDDGFRKADGEEYIVWDLGNNYHQNTFFLHGALHLFDKGSELEKYTWSNTGIRLINQIRTELNNDKFPLFVSEDETQNKMKKIMHHAYLSKCLRSLSSISGSLFIHGHSFAANDLHIINMIPESGIKKLFVSIYGNDQALIQRVEAFAFKNYKELEVKLYDSESAQVWR